MTLFWILCAALLLAALSFLIWPLWRKSASNNNVLRDAANLEILRDQGSEMEADLRNNLLTQDAFEQGRRELQVRLLDEVKSTENPVTGVRNPARILAMVMIVLIPLSSVLLYLKVGNVNAMLPPEQQQAESADGLVCLNPTLLCRRWKRNWQKIPIIPRGG